MIHLKSVTEIELWNDAAATAITIHRGASPLPDADKVVDDALDIADRIVDGYRLRVKGAI